MLGKLADERGSLTIDPEDPARDNEVSGSMLSEAERSHLDERGFVILEDAIPADQADALRDRSMALARQERAGPALRGRAADHRAQSSVVIIDGALWHASSANRTDRERVCLLGFFCRAFLKPQQDQIRIVSDEVVARATPTLKRLLGFDSRPNTLA